MCAVPGRVLSFDVVVQKDDTVDSIAQKLGLPHEVLLAANKGPPSRLPASATRCAVDPLVSCASPLHLGLCVRLPAAHGSDSG